MIGSMFGFTTMVKGSRAGVLLQITKAFGLRQNSEAGLLPLALFERGGSLCLIAGPRSVETTLKA